VIGSSVCRSLESMQVKQSQSYVPAFPISNLSLEPTNLSLELNLSLEATKNKDE